MVDVGALVVHARRGLQKLVTEPREWTVLVGDRLVLAAFLTAGFALATVAVVATGVVAVRDAQLLVYAFQALVGGNLTLLTIVLSINQLVLSREFRTPGELRDQIDSVLDYREHVEATTARETVPVTPARFLRVLLDGARENAQQFGGAARNADDDQVVAAADRFVARITGETDRISHVLDQSQDGIFSALAVTLDTNYSREINEARRLQRQYEAELSDAAHQELTELMENLRQVDIARQYFKSLYMQSELARLSRTLLFIGVPAVGSSIIMLMIYTDVPQSGPVAASLPVLVPAVVILAFAPLAILFSFLLRIATVALRTVAITPFTTPVQEADR